jgi:hypothetical protein
MGEATFAARDIEVGEAVFHITGLLLPFPTMYTICMTPTTHLLFADGAQCLAHSCDPNVRIVIAPDAKSFDVVALRPIPAGALVSFNYLTTEWDMAAPFDCLCGAAQCFGRIAGFKHLSEANQAALAPQATPAMRALLAAEHRHSAVAASSSEASA